MSMGFDPKMQLNKSCGDPLPCIPLLRGQRHLDSEVVRHVVSREHRDVGAPLALAEVLESREEALAAREDLAHGELGVTLEGLVAQQPS